MKATNIFSGKATRDLIALHIRNMLSDYCEGKMQYCQKLRRFIRENVRWMAIKIAEHKHDEYWKQVEKHFYEKICRHWVFRKSNRINLLKYLHTML